MIESNDVRASCEKRCISMGKLLIKNRHVYESIEAVLDDAKLLQSGEYFEVQKDAYYYLAAT